MDSPTVRLSSRFFLNRRVVAAVFLALGLAIPVTVLNAGSLDNEYKPMRIIWPAPVHAARGPGVSAESSEPFVTRTGTVMFAVEQIVATDDRRGDLDTASASLRSRAMVLEFFPGISFTVIVDAQVGPQPEVLALSARRETDSLSTVSITVTPDSYLMTLQDLEKATVYRVVGDTQTGIGVVTEIDLKRMPPVLYSPPVVPPER